MKPFFLSAVLLCLALFSNAQKQGAFLTENDLKGKVKKVNVFLYTDRDSETDTSRAPFITILEFDQKGNLTKETRPGNKIISYKIDYRNNSDNTITGKKHDSDGDLIGGITFRYDSLGSLIEIRRENSMAGPPRQTFKNDDKGFCTEIDNFVDDEVIGSKTLITYGENGLKKSRKTYGVKGEIMDSESFDYDSLKNIVEYRQYFPNGYLSEKQLFSDRNRDQNDNWQLRIITRASHTHDYLFEWHYVIVKRRIEYY